MNREENLKQIRNKSTTWDIAVIGGGAGGVELALSIKHRLGQIVSHATVGITLVTRGEILAGNAVSARKAMRTILAKHGVRGARVAPQGGDEI